MRKFLLASLIITLVSSVAFSQNALDFDGTDDYVYTTYTGISGTSARTIEAWVKTTANCNPSAGGTQQVIVDYGTFVTGGRFTFCLLWSNSVRIEVGGNGLSGTTAVNDGQWHHVAVTYDPTATNQYKLYIDGTLEAQGNLTVSTNTVLGTPVQFGKRVDGAKWFDGSIDEVRIWNTVRTQAQLAQYKDAEFCSMPAGLVAYYNFNHGTAGGTNTGVTTLTDFAGTNNGTLSGFALSGSTSNWVSGASLTSGTINGGTSSIAVCDSWTSPAGITYTSSGMITDTVVAAGGCDSTFTVNLTIYTNTSSTISPVACNVYVSPSGNNTWTSSGTYYDSIPNANGCDSLITINLTIVQLNNGVSQNGNMLTALQGGASVSYQWLDCDNNFAIVPGANSQSFTPSANGNYAVEVSMNGCTDTSTCYAVTGIGIDDSLNDQIQKIYPNPATNKLEVELAVDYESSAVRITNIFGAIVMEFETIENSFTIDLEMLESGLYYLSIINSKGTSNSSFVKK